MNSLLQFFLAIFLGALIGYVTNYLAIKMLFRPHKKYYVFKKIPVPLTPGIIPKKRKGIASGIGGVVGDLLLNEVTIRDKIKAQSTKELLVNTLNNAVVKIKTYEIDTIESLVPIQHRNKLNDFVLEFKKFLHNQLNKYLLSEYFADAIRKLAEKEFDSITNTKLELIIIPEKFEIILKETLNDIINNEMFIDNMLNSIEKYIDGIFESEETLEEFLPERSIDIILDAIKRILPEILPATGKLLVSEDIKKFLSDGIKGILLQLIEELDGFQKFMVNLISINSIIDKEVPTLVNKFITQMKDSLESEETLYKVLEIIENYLSELRKSKLNDLFKNIKKDKYVKFKSDAKKVIKDFVTNKKIMIDSLSIHIMNFINSIGDKTIKDILQGYSPDINNRIKNFLVKILLEITQGENTIKAISSFIDQNIDYAVYNMKIGKLETYINFSEEKQEQIISFITGTILNTLDKETTSILNALNITTMVKNKIDDFPVETVEEIIMKIISSELKYINIFGAFLGAIIGSINFLLNFIMNAS